MDHEWAIRRCEQFDRRNMQVSFPWLLLDRNPHLGLDRSQGL